MKVLWSESRVFDLIEGFLFKNILTMCIKHNPTIGMTMQEKIDYFIGKSIEKFGESTFDYSLVKELQTKKSSIQLICRKHGLIETSFNNHLSSGNGCFKCGDESCRNNKRMTFEEFLKKVDDVIPNKKFKILSKVFKGRQVKYERVYTQDEFGICNVKVTGLLRGEAPTIKSAMFPKLYSTNKYRKVHGYKLLDFTNTEYIKALGYVTVNCRKHGDFSTKPNWLLSGLSCPVCAEEGRKYRMVSNTKTFIRKAIERFGDNRKIFDKVDYVRAKDKIEVLCETHNTYYKITPNDYLTGYRCPECGLISGGWSKEDFIKSSRGRDGILYLIRCWNEEEEFYKIGITTHSVKKRFRGLILPYKYELIHEFICDAGCVWDLEKEHHKYYKNYSQRPLIHFQGYTECFNISLPIEEIIDKLKNT